MLLTSPSVRFIFAGAILSLVVFASCEPEETLPPPSKNIFYKEDGRKALSKEFAPLFLDINEDGVMDFNIFFDLTSNANGDRLYAGINPIGPHLIKAGPPIENNFLGMGFLVAEFHMATINDQLKTDERWTGDHNTLAIRHTANNGTNSYEGSWSDGSNKVVGIQFVSDEKPYFGWLRLRFDKVNETMTLVDYAYERASGKGIRAGDH